MVTITVVAVVAEHALRTNEWICRATRLLWQKVCSISLMPEA